MPVFLRSVSPASVPSAAFHPNSPALHGRSRSPLHFQALRFTPLQSLHSHVVPSCRPREPAAVRLGTGFIWSGGWGTARVFRLQGHAMSPLRYDVTRLFRLHTRTEPQPPTSAHSGSPLHLPHVRHHSAHLERPRKRLRPHLGASSGQQHSACQSGHTVCRLKPPARETCISALGDRVRFAR